MKINLAFSTTIKRICFFVAFSAISFLLQSQLPNQITKTSKVNFKIKNFGVYVDGTFTKAEISSNLDLNNLSKSYIRGSVNVASIDTDNSKRDKHLRSDDYFNAIKYPKIAVNSKEIKKRPDMSYLLTASVKIKETIKIMSIPLEITQTKEGIKIEANFEINRRDFNIGKRSWVLSDEVKINVIHIFKTNF